MQETLLKWLIILYTSTAFIDMLWYWPTIIDLWHHKKPSANIRSYMVWTITTFIWFMYSIFILPNLPFRIVTWVVFISNLTILVLSIRLNKRIKIINK